MIYIVLPLAFLLGGLAVWACVRAIQSGQFDDLETPALRILSDDVGVDADSPTTPPPTTPSA